MQPSSSIAVASLPASLAAAARVDLDQALLQWSSLGSTRALVGDLIAALAASPEGGSDVEVRATLVRVVAAHSGGAVGRHVQALQRGEQGGGQGGGQVGGQGGGHHHRLCGLHYIFPALQLSNRRAHDRVHISNVAGQQGAAQERESICNRHVFNFCRRQKFYVIFFPIVFCVFISYFYGETGFLSYSSSTLILLGMMKCA